MNKKNRILPNKMTEKLKQKYREKYSQASGTTKNQNEVREEFKHVFTFHTNEGIQPFDFDQLSPSFTETNVTVTPADNSSEAAYPNDETLEEQILSRFQKNIEDVNPISGIPLNTDESEEEIRPNDKRFRMNLLGSIWKFNYKNALQKSWQQTKNIFSKAIVTPAVFIGSLAPKTVRQWRMAKQAAPPLRAVDYSAKALAGGTAAYYGTSALLSMQSVQNALTALNSINTLVPLIGGALMATGVGYAAWNSLKAARNRWILNDKWEQKDKKAEIISELKKRASKQNNINTTEERKVLLALDKMWQDSGAAMPTYFSAQGYSQDCYLGFTKIIDDMIIRENIVEINNQRFSFDNATIELLKKYKDYPTDSDVSGSVYDIAVDYGRLIRASRRKNPPALYGALGGSALNLASPVGSLLIPTVGATLATVGGYVVPLAVVLAAIYARKKIIRKDYDDVTFGPDGYVHFKRGLDEKYEYQDISLPPLAILTDRQIRYHGSEPADSIKAIVSEVLLKFKQSSFMMDAMERPATLRDLYERIYIYSAKNIPTLLPYPNSVIVCATVANILYKECKKPLAWHLSRAANGTLALTQDTYRFFQRYAEKRAEKKKADRSKPITPPVPQNTQQSH